MTLAEVMWFVMGAGVVAYALTGGADFGGGVLHLFAAGARRDAQRKAVEEAIAPIWEANHVWLIFVIVALFTTFPSAFAVVSIALHIPLTLALVGIVLRGASFVFHSYDLRKSPRSRGWARAFGWSSLVTPFVLGDCLGALSTSAIRWDGRLVTTGFFAGWTTPFALGTGLFTVLSFTLLAAVYLTADSEALVQDDFRRRALALEVATGLVAFAVFLLSRSDAPVLFVGLSASAGSFAVQGATALAAFVTLGALGTRRYRVARATVALQIALVVVGWGLSMRGAIVLPDVRIDNAGARPEVVRAILPALVAGAAMLLPSLLYLFRIFKVKT